MTTMQGSARDAAQTRLALSQRELLGLILACAASGSASFSQALHAVEGAAEGGQSQAVCRELLSDLAIRDWIELRQRRTDGRETRIPRLRYELELAAQANWDEHSDRPPVRYVLTDKGRAQVGPLLRSLRERDRAAPR